MSELVVGDSYRVELGDGSTLHVRLVSVDRVSVSGSDEIVKFIDETNGQTHTLLYNGRNHTFGIYGNKRKQIETVEVVSESNRTDTRSGLDLLADVADSMPMKRKLGGSRRRGKLGGSRRRRHRQSRRRRGSSRR